MNEARKALSLFLLVAGWLVIIAAIALLQGQGARAGFAVAGVAVEVAGLVMLCRSHMQRERVR